MTRLSGRQFPPFLWARVNMKIQLLPPQTNTYRASTYWQLHTPYPPPPPSPPPILSLPFLRNVKLSCSSRLSHTGTSTYTTTSLSLLHLYPYICFLRLQNISGSFSITTVVIKLLPTCCSDVCQAQRAGRKTCWCTGKSTGSILIQPMFWVAFSGFWFPQCGWCGKINSPWTRWTVYVWLPVLTDGHSNWLAGLCFVVAQHSKPHW